MKLTQKIKSWFTELICFNISGYIVKIPWRSIETDEANSINFSKRKLFETEVQIFDLDTMKVTWIQFDIISLTIEIWNTDKK